MRYLTEPAAHNTSELPIINNPGAAAIDSVCLHFSVGQSTVEGVWGRLNVCHCVGLPGGGGLQRVSVCVFLECGTTGRTVVGHVFLSSLPAWSPKAHPGRK